MPVSSTSHYKHSLLTDRACNLPTLLVEHMTNRSTNLNPNGFHRLGVTAYPFVEENIQFHLLGTV